MRRRGTARRVTDDRGDNGHRLGWPPPGCQVRYEVPNTAGPDGLSVATGIVAGRPEQSTTTGRILVPVRESTDHTGAISRWVAMRNILAVTPASPAPDNRVPGLRVDC